MYKYKVDMENAKLFWRIMYHLYYDRLLSYDPKGVVSKKGVIIRKKIAPLILKVLPKINPYELEIIQKEPIPKEYKERPIIYTPTHGFKDDVLNTILTIQDHGYILFGSVDELFKTFDGLFALIWGSVPVVREDKESRSTSISKMVRAINLGTNGIVFPEGAWNLSDNALALKLYPGFYRIAQETNAVIVPVATHIEGKKCYSIQGKAIDIINDGFTEKQACSYLRDVLATLKYELMLVGSDYSNQKRAELEKEIPLREQWELYKAYLKKQPKYYIEEKEKNYPYKDKNIITEEEVFNFLNNIDLTSDKVTKEKALILSKIRKNQEFLKN